MTPNSNMRKKKTMNQNGSHESGTPPIIEALSDHPSTCSPQAYEKNFLISKKRHGRRWSALTSSPTCLSHEDLVLLAQTWNDEYQEGENLPKARMKKKISPILLRNASSEDLTKELIHRLGPLGPELLDTEMLRKHPALCQRLKSRFRPKKPASWTRNPVAWLSTTDIEVVMQQYQTLHPDFAFLGVHPRDFADLDHASGAAMREVPIKEYLATGIRHAGAIMNLDKNDQAGSHWVACFLSLDPTRPMYGAYYYDSVARPPPQEIATWMVNLRDRVSALSSSKNTHDVRLREFVLTYNKDRRQFQNTECGMFAMFFLAVAMQNRSIFEDICMHMGTDADMAAMRNVMFR